MSKGKGFTRPTPKKTRLFKIEDIPPLPNYDLKKPIFSLRNIQYQGDYCISKCKEESKASILDTLLRISQLTWGQIKSRPREKLGCEPIPQDRFTAPFPLVITPDVKILVFRFSDIGRIAGYRDNDIFHIILVGHKLYKH